MDPRDSEHTVYVVDDDAAVCDALRMLLRAAGLRVETFRSAASFLKAYRPAGLSCLVLDIRMPGMNGLDLQDELHKRKFLIPIVFLTGHGDVPMAVRALKKGAVDFIEKPHDEEQLVLTVLNALRVDSDRLKQASRYEEVSDDLASRLAALSPREREVLDRVLETKQTRQISDELCISVKTVEFHRARIREKLGVTSLAGLFGLFSTSARLTRE
jgi:RNA polymerase sigma factor (sigma-70 family)